MNLLAIFTSEDKDEIKREVKQLILDRVKRDLEDYDRFIVCGDDIRDMFEGVLDECKEEIKADMMVKIRESMEEKLRLL